MPNYNELIRQRSEMFTAYHLLGKKPKTTQLKPHGFTFKELFDLGFLPEDALAACTCIEVPLAILDALYHFQPYELDADRFEASLREFARAKGGFKYLEYPKPTTIIPYNLEPPVEPFPLNVAWTWAPWGRTGWSANLPTKKWNDYATAGTSYIQGKIFHGRQFYVPDNFLRLLFEHGVTDGSIEYGLFEIIDYEPLKALHERKKLGGPRMHILIHFHPNAPEDAFRWALNRACRRTSRSRAHNIGRFLRRPLTIDHVREQAHRETIFQLIHRAPMKTIEGLHAHSKEIASYALRHVELLGNILPELLQNHELRGHDGFIAHRIQANYFREHLAIREAIEEYKSSSSNIGDLYNKLYLSQVPRYPANVIEHVRDLTRKVA